jgi:branched-chain amino acid transport system substrate-binding protein
MRLQKLLFQTTFIIVFPGLIGQNTKAIQNSAVTDKSVKIGLLITDNNSLSAVHGAEMAIRKANEQGGYRSKPFQLIVRSMEGPWGTGSKEAVNLIYEESVCALMASCDGRNSHLVEQVTAKTRIVFLSAWASDPTLSQAFVPWYFSCVPTDLQQAHSLIEEIYNKRKLTKIAAFSGDDYDSKLALENFVKLTKLEEKTVPLQLFYDNNNENLTDLIDQINNADIKCIVLFGKHSASVQLLQQLEHRKINVLIFGTLSLLNEDEISDQDMKYYENVIFVSSLSLPESKNLTFSEDYQRTYGKLPGIVAEYAFDGMNLLIEAINSAGFEREGIQNYLSKIRYSGVTGLIQFDNKGKRMDSPGLMQIKNGIPVPVEK